MLPYKLTLAFDDFNKVIDFYKNELGKEHKRALATITSMGAKGQVVTNPDNSITITWFFRSFAKYNKVVSAYLEFIMRPSEFIPQTKKTFNEEF